MADDKLELEGKVIAALGNGMFTVEIDNTKDKTKVHCTLSGRIRKNNIKILEGDRVKIEVSVYDLTKGRITYRTKL